MNPSNHERLLRLLEGALTPEEETRLRQEVARSPALRAELEALTTLQGLLRSTVHASSEQALQPFFADRLLRRMTPASPRPAGLTPDEEFFGLLLRLFRPVAVAGLFLILGFAAYNVTLSGEYAAQASTTEAVFGLPPVTLATAHDLDLSTTPPTDP